MHLPATLDIQPSRRLRAAFVLVHLLALGALLPFLPAWAIIMLPPVFFLSSWRACDGLKGGRLTLFSDASIEWQHADASGRSGDVLADSVAFRSLVVLRIRLQGESQVRAVLVLPDSTTATDFRRLQIWMRWVRPFRRRADAV